MKNVLVIEDEIELQRAIKLKLEREGFNVKTVMSGEEGLVILESQLPDFIWLDLLLPGMGGLRFLETLRKNPKYHTLPVMIVSVSASLDKIQRAFNLNVVDYIIKSQHDLGDIVKKVKDYYAEQGK